MKRPNYRSTVFACFTGYVVQAAIVNFAPLLFLTFQATYGIPLSQITLLITVNFVIQLLVDFLSANIVDKIGYRPCILAANVFCAAGLVGLAVLPDLLPSAYAGLLIATAFYAVGGGLIEVLISPIVEACPSEHKEKRLSLLHSFYCWGHVGVVLLSTLFFVCVGIEHWKLLAVLWAALPVLCFCLFLRAPIAPVVEEGERGMSTGELLKNKIFWLLLLMMICAGASEQAVSQWASLFAEQGLGVSKTLGDLFGPTLFAVCMGTSRALFGKLGHKLHLDRFMTLSCLLCVCSYLLLTLVPNTIVNLIACGMSGFSVGIMWPGTLSTATGALKRGGTAMFALLALGGDIGCMLGPTLSGGVSSASGSLKGGILSAIVFPVLLTVSVLIMTRAIKKSPPCPPKDLSAEPEQDTPQEGMSEKSDE